MWISTAREIQWRCERRRRRRRRRVDRWFTFGAIQPPARRLRELYCKRHADCLERSIRRFVAELSTPLITPSLNPCPYSAHTSNESIAKLNSVVNLRMSPRHIHSRPTRRNVGDELCSSFVRRRTTLTSLSVPRQRCCMVVAVDHLSLPRFCPNW